MTQLIQFEGCTVAVIAPEDLEALEAMVAEAVRMIEGYKRAGWLTNPAAAEQATDFIARASASGGTSHG
jgi:galactokinase